MPTIDSSSHAGPTEKPTKWHVGAYTVGLLIASPFAALPLTFLLMLVLGDGVFGPSLEASAGLAERGILALKNSVAAIYIALIFIGERAVFVLPVLVPACVACASWLARAKRGWRGAGAVVLLFGIAYPAVLLIGTQVGWDKGLFN